MTTNITARRIVALREKQGLLQPDLAQLAQIEQSYVSKLERGLAPNVSGVVLARIATALETTTDYLLGLSDDPNPRPAPNHASFATREFRQLAEAWAYLSDAGMEADLKILHGLAVHTKKRIQAIRAKEE